MPNPDCEEEEKRDRQAIEVTSVLTTQVTQVLHCNVVAYKVLCCAPSRVLPREYNCLTHVSLGRSPWAYYVALCNSCRL